MFHVVEISLHHHIRTLSHGHSFNGVLIWNASINDLMFSGYVIDKANINGEKNLCMTDND